MNCVKARDLLGMYLDGELRGRRRRSVQDHLEACESCRSELAWLSSISARLTALPVCEPNEAFYRRLFQRVWEQRQTARPGTRYVWGTALAAAAMLVLFMVVRPSPEPVELAGTQRKGGRAVEVAAVQPAAPKPAPDVQPEPPEARRQPLQAAMASPARMSGSRPAKVARAHSRPVRVARPRAVGLASRPEIASISRDDERPAPTQEQVAAVSEALLRLTAAAQETGDALHRAVVLQAKQQETARVTLEMAFSAFAASPVGDGKAPVTDEL